MEQCAMSAWGDRGRGKRQPGRPVHGRPGCRPGGVGVLKVSGLALALALSILSTARAGERAPMPLGRPATAAEIATRDIDVRGTDGAGLPPGRGTVTEGEDVYARRCASCHGEFGEGTGRMPALIGGEGTLATDRPRRTIGSFWPYAPSVFDYIRRSMPFGEAHSLTVNELYALVAFLLEANGIVEADFVATPESLPRVRMPNRDGFVPDTRKVITGPRCFRKCLKTPPKIMAIAPDAAATAGQGERE